MSKELEALDTMYGIALNGVLPHEKKRLEECMTILEKELEEKEQQDNVIGIIEEEPLDVVSKKLKALEIIKEKGVNIYFLKEIDYVDEYNELIKSHLGMKKLTRQEYELLKEVLL